MSKSYWIWNYGDYEVYHTMKVHLRREERGYHRPAVWKISTPSVALKFIKEFTCEKDGYMLCHFNGIGHAFVGDKRYNEKVRIPLAKGTHKVEIQVSNLFGLPALFVDSADKNAAFCVGVVAPLMISFITANASSYVKSSLFTILTIASLIIKKTPLKVYSSPIMRTSGDSVMP